MNALTAYDRGRRDRAAGRPYSLPFGKTVEWIIDYRNGYYAVTEED